MSGDSHFRRTERRPVALAVHFVRIGAAALEQRGMVLDMGLGGLQVRTDRPPDVGTRLRLRLVAPSAWEPLELGAEVRWVRREPDGAIFGAAFARMSPVDAQALADLLAATRFEEAQP